MRTFFRYVLMALILLAVALMSALTAMRVAIHGREVSVPNFARLTPAQAEKLATSNGLLAEVEGHFYSADVPEGRIVSQQPPVGTRVRRGWHVLLASSLGPQRAAIPNVVGESARAAELNIRLRGLEVGTIAQVRLPGTPPGQVVAQTPPPNAQVSSPRIDLLLTAPDRGEPMVMPNFVGRKLGAAVAEVQRAGLQVATPKPATAIGEPSASSGGSQLFPAATAIITAQNPMAGQKVFPGATVQFTVRAPGSPATTVSNPAQ